MLQFDINYTSSYVIIYNALILFYHLEEEKGEIFGTRGLHSGISLRHSMRYFVFSCALSIFL